MNVISSLQVVETEKICLHEEHETTRLKDTCSALSEEGVLRHPPLAMRMRDGRYLILDGAHRTAALRHLKCRWIPVQVVEPADFRLEAWDHVVPIGPWIHKLRNELSLCWEANHSGKPPVAEIIFSDGKSFFLYPNDKQDDLRNTLDVWHRIVGSYSKSCTVQRKAQGSVLLPDEGTVCLRYPVYTIDEIEKIVTSGLVMPAGVTRFLVSGRLLNLRIPISMLKSSTFNSGEWEGYCRQWEGSLRLYAETVYLCEA